MITNAMKTCAVIPAAGRGSRLGIEVPKILAPVGEDATVWTILKDKLRPFADHIHVVLSPEGAPVFLSAAAADLEGGFISTSLQPEPIGMGDAIFRGRPVWERADLLLVIWGDQVHVSAETLRAALALHGGAARRFVLPVVALEEPYVEYRFSAAGCLDAVLQTREGDVCRPGGFGDVGTFLLSTAGLLEAWEAYLGETTRGARTGEVNFLPFLVFLSRLGWEVMPHRVADPFEARGINTPADLEFFRRLYGARQAASPASPSASPNTVAHNV